MHNRCTFCESTSNGTDCGQLTDAKSGEDGSKAYHSCICFRCVTSINFIAVANPSHSAGLDVVERKKAEISRYPMKRLAAKLMQTREEIFGERDRLASRL